MGLEAQHQTRDLLEEVSEY